MVYKKQLAKRPRSTFILSSSSSDSDPSTELISGSSSSSTMTHRTRKLPKTTLDELPTLRLSPGETLSTSKGRWRDVQFFFVEKDISVPDEYYFRNLSEVYKMSSGGPVFYDQCSMDAELSHLPGTCTPMAPLLDIANTDKLDECFRSCFHLDDKVVWRWPEPHERIYHRPGDGLVGVSLEHLRSGYKPPLSSIH